MNTLRSRHKQCHFNRTKSPLYVVKLKMVQNGRQLTAVHSVEPIVPSLLENSFSSLLAENILHLNGFLSEIYLQSCQYG